jgi:hypothetical protein
VPGIHVAALHSTQSMRLEPSKDVLFVFITAQVLPYLSVHTTIRFSTLLAINSLRCFMIGG